MLRKFILLKVVILESDIKLIATRQESVTDISWLALATHHLYSISQLNSATDKIICLFYLLYVDSMRVNLNFSKQSTINKSICTYFLLSRYIYFLHI